MRPLSLVSELVHDKNSIPNSSRDDHSLMNQHLASVTARVDGGGGGLLRVVPSAWVCVWIPIYVPDIPFSAVCSAIIFFAMVLILHFGGAIRCFIWTKKSVEYLERVIIWR